VHPEIGTIYYKNGAVTDLPNPLSQSTETTISDTVQDILSVAKLDMLKYYLKTKPTTRLRKVLRPDLEANFRAKWDEYKAKYPEDKNLHRPRIGFHGTKPHLLDLISETGLKVPDGEKVKHASDSGWWGKGIYTSGDPNYASGYSGDGRVIVVAVLCGKVYNCVQRRDGGKLEPGYDSHVAEDGREWVLFESAQVLPLFVMENRNQEYSNEPGPNELYMYLKHDTGEFLPPTEMIEKSAYRLYELEWSDDPETNYYAAWQMMYDGVMGYVLPKIKKESIQAKAHELWESGFSQDAKKCWYEAVYLLQYEQYLAQGTSCPLRWEDVEQRARFLHQVKFDSNDKVNWFAACNQLREDASLKPSLSEDSIRERAYRLWEEGFGDNAEKNYQTALIQVCLAGKRKCLPLSLSQVFCFFQKS
jgi:hypothetical protein